MNTVINLPIILTLTRLILSIFCIPILFINILPLQNQYLNFLLFIFFISLSFTDFLDGYLARRYSLETQLGKLLDPLADKFLLFTTLISLVAVGKLYFFWAILLIGREFFIMGLREISLKYGFAINVSSFGKLKTFIQVVLISFLIIKPDQTMVPGNSYWNMIEFLLLYFSVFISFFSAYQYYLMFIKNIKSNLRV